MPFPKQPPLAEALRFASFLRGHGGDYRQAAEDLYDIQGYAEYEYLSGAGPAAPTGGQPQRFAQAKGSAQQFKGDREQLAAELEAWAKEHEAAAVHAKPGSGAAPPRAKPRALPIWFIPVLFNLAEWLLSQHG